MLLVRETNPAGRIAEALRGVAHGATPVAGLQITQADPKTRGLKVRPRAREQLPLRAYTPNQDEQEHIMSISLGNSETVTRAMVEAVPLPLSTRSYKPVAYGDAINFLHDTIANDLGLPIIKETYGLNKKGDQLFALATLDTGDGDSGLSIGLRQSYNKSLALGVAVGSRVFVCDNLCFSGDAFMVVRKNTTNVWEDFKALVAAQVSGALGHHTNMQADVAKLKATPCNVRRGYSFLGVMQGEGLLTPTQSTVAFGDWTKPRHAEFADRNMWGLYNAITEGLKKGAPARTIDRHAGAHSFMLSMCNDARPSRPSQPSN